MLMNEETCILKIISVQHARKAKKGDQEKANFNIVVLDGLGVFRYKVLNCLPLLLMRGN